MQINNEFELKEIVYHQVSKFGDELMKGVVIQLIVSGPEAVEYKVAWESQQEGIHSPAELLSNEDYQLNKLM